MGDLELEPCGHCGAPTALEDLSHHGEDADFCPECAREWQETFNACDHDWATIDESGQPWADEYGDLAKYCHKCSGLVLLEDDHA